jgi:peptidoglycan/LPS O-acetylase OafA/YrhL
VGQGRVDKKTNLLIAFHGFWPLGVDFFFAIKGYIILEGNQMYSTSLSTEGSLIKHQNTT